MAGPDADDLGFELLPADDAAVDESDDVDAAAESALEDSTGLVEDDDETPEPFGISWEFDFVLGRFARRGMSPSPVSGLDALAQWCMLALRSARYAHAVFSGGFGMEDPEDVLGEVQVDELSGDFEERIREALLIHDRISDVDVTVDWDPTQGLIFVTELTITTDDDAELVFSDFALERAADA